MQRIVSFSTTRAMAEDSSEIVTKRMCFSFIFSVGFLALLAGFLLGRFTFDQELEASRSKLRKAHQDQQVLNASRNYSYSNYSQFVDKISASNILQYLTELGSQGDSTGASGSLHEAQILRRHLVSNSFDVISPLISTEIHLSYPNPNLPNQVSILNETGQVVWRGEDSRPKFSEDEPRERRSSATAHAEGNVVYLNYGRNEDYHYLDSLGIDVKKRIVIARAGRILATEMVNIALDHEAQGILIFLDPQQKEFVSPLLNFVDLAKLQASLTGFREKSVPVLIITWEDAQRIFDVISGNPSPESWRGGMPSLYPIGPDFSFSNWTMKMEVNTANVVKTYYNVVGAIKGSHEPDRFVIVANERNPWAANGERQKSSAVVMEVAAMLGTLKKEKGWRPYRSILIASWGLDGPELATSRPNDWWAHLEMKTIAYLKVDLTKSGCPSFHSRGSPLLEKAFVDSLKMADLKVPNLDYMVPVNGDESLVYHGVPFVEILSPERLDNTTLEKFTAFWTVLTLYLSDSHRSPFGLDAYMTFFNHSVNEVEDRFRKIAQKHSLFLETLHQSVRRLVSKMSSFKDKWRHVDRTNPLEMRIINDKLLRLAHSFACRSDSLELKHTSRHLIFSRSKFGTDPSSGFGMLQDLLKEMTLEVTQDDLNKQIVTDLTTLVECVDSARKALSDDLETVVAVKQERQLELGDG